VKQIEARERCRSLGTLGVSAPQKNKTTGLYDRPENKSMFIERYKSKDQFKPSQPKKEPA
jgi:hypothetical protein